MLKNFTLEESLLLQRAINYYVNNVLMVDVMYPGQGERDREDKETIMAIYNSLFRSQS